MKVLAFGASNSKNSINRQLATYAVTLLDGEVDSEVIDLNDYEMPLYSIDREQASGIPEQAKSLFGKIGDSDAVIVSFAEHNGSYTAAYKNIFDWCSRIDQKVFQNKAVIFLSTSPGPRGASSVLAAATGSAPFFAAEIKGTLSVPSFHSNFDSDTGHLTNDEIKAHLKSILDNFLQ
ncbi:NADPH-dependent FMN reductase [Endozoicomonas lisbonensis]|uniref:Chromate reductase n=1 Tax=Endozoicomonas lisbonensis TaxID=3120522 RepID=A0ABV2SIY1_9GAMM